MNQQEMLSLLDPELRKEAVDLTPYGVREFAFPLRAAQRVLAEIVHGGGVVLGGDLWTVRDDGFYEPGHDNWFVNHVPGESFDDFTARQADAANRFFERQEDDGRSCATFVLSKEEQWPSLDFTGATQGEHMRCAKMRTRPWSLRSRELSVVSTYAHVPMSHRRRLRLGGPGERVVVRWRPA